VFRRRADECERYIRNLFDMYKRISWIIEDLEAKIPELDMADSHVHMLEDYSEIAKEYLSPENVESMERTLDNIHQMLHEASRIYIKERRVDRALIDDIIISLETFRDVDVVGKWVRDVAERCTYIIKRFQSFRE